MRAKAAARERGSRFRRGEQRHCKQRQRNGADPVEPHRRQLLGAVGIGRLADTQTVALPEYVTPGTAARGTTKQSLHRKMGPDSGAAIVCCWACFTQRDPKEEPDQIGAGEKSVHRFDQSRIAIDQGRRVVVFRHDIVERLGAVPGELLADHRQRGTYLRPIDALLDRLAAANTGSELSIGMRSDQFAAAKHGLRLLGRAKDKFLHQYFVFERALALNLRRASLRSPSLWTNQMPWLAVPTDVLTTQGNRAAARASCSELTMCVAGCGKCKSPSSRLSRALLCKLR